MKKVIKKTVVKKYEDGGIKPPKKVNLAAPIGSKVNPDYEKQLTAYTKELKDKGTTNFPKPQKYISPAYSAGNPDRKYKNGGVVVAKKKIVVKKKK